MHSPRNKTPVNICSALLISLMAACGGGGDGGIPEPPAPPPPPPSPSAPLEIVPGPANAVTTWHEIAVKTMSDPPVPGGATPSERVPRSTDVVTVQLAVYDAAMAITGSHKPYAVTSYWWVPSANHGPLEAAVIEAAYRTLKGLFPSRGTHYEAAYTSAMNALPADGDNKAMGQVVGAEVAERMLALRAYDGRETALPPYVPGTGLGQFSNANPLQRIAPHVRPFTNLGSALFRLMPPYPMNMDVPSTDYQSVQYTLDFDEVKRMGALKSTARSAAQTEVARFYTEMPDAWFQRNMRRLATHSPDLGVSARLLAMLVTAQHDALGACYDSKYAHNFWRPASAIRLADIDANPATEADPSWEPVLATPSHPEYPAAHGCTSGATAEVLEAFFGTAQIGFELDSMATRTTRRLASTYGFVQEMSDARVWGGMHFRSSVHAGAELGRKVARFMLASHFAPRP